MSDEVRVAVVGMGKLGLLHAGTFNALSGSRLVAVADPVKTVGEALAGRMNNVKAFTNHKDLLKYGEFDAAVIAAPTHLHVPLGLDFAEAGIPIFVEKPLSLTAAQGRELCDTVERRSIANLVGYMTRYQPSFRKAHALLQSGVLGELQLMRSSMYVEQLFARGKGWRYDPKLSGGGVLMTQNTHLLDLLLWYFGTVDTVSGHTSQLYSTTVEDHAHVVFRFKSGLHGSLDASWSVRGYRTPSITIFVQGRNGELTVTDDDVTLTLDKSAGSLDAGQHLWRQPDLNEVVPFDIGGAHYTLEALDFLSAVRGGPRPDSDVHSALMVQQVVDAAYASANAGGAPVRPETL